MLKKAIEALKVTQDMPSKEDAERKTVQEWVCSSPLIKGPEYHHQTNEQILSNLKNKPVPQPPPGTSRSQSHSTDSASLTGGYDDEIFVNRPPKDFQCIVCLMVVREPHLITCCGAIICKVCMSLSNAKVECPQCRDKNDHLVVPDKRTRGQTMSLEVKCTNTGCQWTGELLDYHEHVDEKCSMCSVPCKYKCGLYFKAIDIAIHEEAYCTNRPYDVIMRYQEKLVNITREMGKSMKKVELENQKLKKELSDLQKKSSSNLLPEDDNREIECPACRHVFCKTCKNRYHFGQCAETRSDRQEAPQYTPVDYFYDQGRLQQTCWYDERDRFIHGSQGIKRCPGPGCQAQIENRGGCNHITCTKCHHEFCWLCMIPWERRCQEDHWFGQRTVRY